jgi:hypothetical protein
MDGYRGAPLRPPLRAVRPPVPVLLDLAVLFPRQPHRSGRYHPGGLQLDRVVTGTLSCWGLCEQGQWWGLVSYDVRWGAQSRSVTHWVPAWTVRQVPKR